MPSRSDKSPQAKTCRCWLWHGSGTGDEMAMGTKIVYYSPTLAPLRIPEPCVNFILPWVDSSRWWLEAV